MVTQGAKANISGKILEGVVTNTLSKRGFAEISFKNWKKIPLYQQSDKFLIHNAPYHSIYTVTLPQLEQKESRSEFIISDPIAGIFCRIECKWQDSSGSVDEKLPYLYLNAVECWQENEIIILIDGKGWRTGALSWLKNAVDSRKWRDDPEKDTRNISMMDISTFTSWCQAKF